MLKKKKRQCLSCTYCVTDSVSRTFCTVLLSSVYRIKETVWREISTVWILRLLDKVQREDRTETVESNQWGFRCPSVQSRESNHRIQWPNHRENRCNRIRKSKYWGYQLRQNQILLLGMENKEGKSVKGETWLLGEIGPEIQCLKLKGQISGASKLSHFA